MKVVIPDPPTYQDIGKSRRRYYYTAQIFYSGINPHVRRQIVATAKWFLLAHLNALPRLNPRIRLDLTMFNQSNGTQDPDNLFFWGKLVLDVLKGRAIPDDSKRYVSRVSYGYGDGPSALVLEIEEGL